MRDYRERLAVPAAWWLLAIPVVILLGGYGMYANLGTPVVVGLYAVLAAGFAAALLAWGSGLTEVRGGELHAGGAVLPLSQVTEVHALNPRQAGEMRGPRADPAAHTLIRPYLKAAVYIAISDPAGQVPYWLIGTRRPAELAAVIERGRPKGTPAAAQGSAG